MAPLNGTRPGLPETVKQFGAGNLLQIFNLERKKSRIKMVFPIRMWGTDSTSKRFNILAYTLNVSNSGARIGGVNIPLGVGDAVTVQYRQQRASFKVAWVGRAGDMTQEQIGVMVMDRNLLFRL